MRKFILVTVLLFPLMSGITSVIMAEPVTDDAATALTHDFGVTNVALRLEP